MPTQYTCIGFNTISRKSWN